MTRFMLQLLSATALSAIATAASAAPNSSTFTSIDPSNTSVVTIKQVGTDNSISGTAYGFGNSYKMTQTGTSNSTEVNSGDKYFNGSSNSTVTATSTGDHNKIKLSVGGSYSLATDNAKATITVKGNANNIQSGIGGTDSILTNTVTGNANTVNDFAHGPATTSIVTITGDENRVDRNFLNGPAPFEISGNTSKVVVKGNKNTVYNNIAAHASTAILTATGDRNVLGNHITADNTTINLTASGNDNIVAVLPVINGTNNSVVRNSTLTQKAVGDSNKVFANFSSPYGTNAVTLNQLANGLANDLTVNATQDYAYPTVPSNNTTIIQTALGDVNRITTDSYGSQDTISNLRAEGNANKLSGSQYRASNSSSILTAKGDVNELRVDQGFVTNSTIKMNVAGSNNNTGYSFQGFVQAYGKDNNATIGVTGDNNHIDGRQFYQDNATLTFSAIGHGHYLTGNQGYLGAMPQASGNNLKLATNGSFNRLAATQNGNGNSTTQTVQGAWNQVETTQSGSGNSLTAQVLDADKLIHDNKLSAEQDGNANTLKLSVNKGSNNTIDAEQSGNGNTVLYSGNGSGNTAKLKATENGNSITASQSGFGNSLNLSSQGSGNTINATQSGTNNSIVVDISNRVTVASNNIINAKQLEGDRQKLRLFVNGGSNNNLDATQKGYGNYMSLTLDGGSNNVAKLSQEGNNLNYNVTMTGSGKVINVAQRN